MKKHIILESEVPHRYGGITIPRVFEVDQTCDACGRTYIALTYNHKLWTTGNCIECSETIVDRMEDEELRGSIEKKRANYQAICPQKYFDFKRNLLPNPTAYDQVLSWTYGKKGLLLLGESERGKSRSAWRLMNRLYILDSINFEAITELQFSHEVAKFGKSEALNEWIKKLCKVKVLFIDDLGKCVMTERVVSEMFYVLEERMSHDRPVIATMQIGSDAMISKIASRAGKEMAEAIMNRLKSNCELVYF